MAHLSLDGGSTSSFGYLLFLNGFVNVFKQQSVDSNGQVNTNPFPVRTSHFKKMGQKEVEGSPKANHYTIYRANKYKDVIKDCPYKHRSGSFRDNS